MSVINIPFNNPNRNQPATFSLGKCLANTNLCVRSLFKIRPTPYNKGLKNTNLMKYKKCKICTNECGNFSINIPAYTIYIKLQIKIYSCSNVTIRQKFKAHFKHNYNSGYTGAGNNLEHPQWGMYQENLLRKCPADYANNIDSMAIRCSPESNQNPNPRHISNLICKTIKPKPNSMKLSDICWIWGQFLDHELDLTTEMKPVEYENITTPKNDKYPNMQIIFKRSIYSMKNNIRQQMSMISSFIDGSVVYGDSTIRAYALRELNGNGKLKISNSNNNEVLAGYNIYKLDNAGLPNQASESLFLFGDIRGNENIALTAMQTLFVREHNRICDKLHNRYKGLDEVIYQKARGIVTGIIQYITYYEFLPALLGKDAIPKYSGYNTKVNPAITTEFSTVGYRLGHSMISPFLQVDQEQLKIRDCFFNPKYIAENGIDQILCGASKHIMQEIDNQVIDDLRDFLFGAPGNGHLLDLCSLNIQRGRDHGIPCYNEIRKAYGLAAKLKFTGITSNSELADKLGKLYVSPDYIDPWIGALCEDHLPGKAVGELIYHILVEQFVRLRDGDRFWFENNSNLNNHDLTLIYESSLAAVINRNCNCNIGPDAFHV